MSTADEMADVLVGEHVDLDDLPRVQRALADAGWRDSLIAFFHEEAIRSARAQRELEYDFDEIWRTQGAA